MPTKPYKILAVDDSPQLQALLRAVLTEAGYDLCCAANCRQALALVQSAAPDAILLDVMLPDGDGFSLLSVCGGRATFRCSSSPRGMRMRPACAASASGRMIISPSLFSRRSFFSVWPPCCAGCTRA